MIEQHYSLSLSAYVCQETTLMYTCIAMAAIVVKTGFEPVLVTILITVDLNHHYTSVASTIFRHLTICLSFQAVMPLNLQVPLQVRDSNSLSLIKLRNIAESNCIRGPGENRILVQTVFLSKKLRL